MRFPFNKKDCHLTIFLFLLIPIWIGVAPEWYTWYNKDENALYAKWLYTLLNERRLVNIPICSAIIYLFIRGYHKIREDKSCRCAMLPLSILGLVILYCDSQVIYANIIYGFDYRILFSSLLTITAIIASIKIAEGVLLAKRASQYNKICEAGFSTDNPNPEGCPSNLRNYASTIIDKLLVTDISEHSFALGITGEWGCGKTTFLKLLKDQLKNKADIVEFNPWMCRTPEQVTHDFFASLRHQLSPKYSSLSNHIKKYSKYINNLSLTPRNVLGTEISFSSNEKSLYENKKELSDIFSSLPRPVTVIIDDIDRLEREEVFEVLRLVRNTADLCNTIYIVAYDKEYVTSVLEERSIKDASLYLEKIFQTEVHLPKVSSHMIWDCLQIDIKKQKHTNNNFAQILFQHFNYDDRNLILRVLGNYRRAKRFARIFMLNISYFSKQYKEEVKVLDIFWLELLQSYDSQTYDKLYNDPSSLLYSNGHRLQLRPGIAYSTKEEDEITYNGEKFWKKETPEILIRLFSTYTKTRKESICYTENYEKYFAFNIPPYQLSIKETNELFIPDSHPTSTIDQWFNNGKHIDSIIYQFKQIDVNRLTDEKLKILVEGILYLGFKIISSNIYHISNIIEIKIFLRKERFTPDNQDFVHNVTLSWFKSRINEGIGLIHLSALLSALYVTRNFDPDGDEQPIEPLVISNTEIEELLAEIIDKFLTNNPQYTALDILKEDNELYDLFSNCCIATEDYTAYDNSCEYKQTAFDIAIEHFSRKKEKPTQEKYTEAYTAFTRITPPQFTDVANENYWWECITERTERKTERHFGSLYNKMLKEFESKCFISTPKPGSLNPQDKHRRNSRKVK